MKYAKIKNKDTKQCEVGIGTNTEFYKSIGMSEMEVEQGFDGNWYVKGFAPVMTDEIMAELASTISMTKAEFLLLVTNLSPVTLAQIEEYVESDPDIKIRFTYANTVERNHPLLDGASSVFGISSQMLDIMFLQKDELIAKINSGEPIESIT